MSQSQAKAARRKITNGYTHLGGAMKRPMMKGASNRSVAESIAAARRTAARQSAAAGGKKK